MPKFAYTAVAPDGQTVEGTEKADNAGAVEIDLLERDLQVVHVEEKRGLMQFELTRKRVPRSEVMHFSRQLAVFIRAGIPILDAIEAIRDEATNPTFRTVLTEIGEALRGGDTLSAAVAVHEKVFPPYYVGILRSAELTGNIDTVLEQLSDYIERDLEARRKIVAALIYPAVVFVMSIATVLVLAIFVLPRFKRFFASLDAKLPLITRILLRMSNFAGHTWYFFVGAVLLLVLGYVLAMRREGGREARDSVLLKLPVAGDVVMYAVIERFCRILGSMVRAGVPLPDAMEVTADATSNLVYRKGLTTARQAMIEGEGLARPLAATNLFPGVCRRMIRVGEETGTLDQQLETAAVYYDRELDYKIKRFTNLFEPAVIVIMGVVVGFVAIALVSAMYGIFRQTNLR